ncbi:MAG: S9 family peptidase [Acidobacteria bacterium]|nr:S9 family peptidase [Acidobacteriota bacterium]
MDSEKRRHEIWRASIVGRTRERIFAGDLGLDSFEPSPNGKWIVYRSNGTGELDHARKFDLWVLDLTARRTRQLTARDGEERSMVWSPDSTRVAFLAPRTPGIRQSQEEIFIAPILISTEGKTSEPQQVTKDFTGSIEQLKWPAKSDSVIFSADVRTGSRFFSLNTSDSTARVMSPETATVSSPDCSADTSVCALLIEARDALPEISVLRSGIFGTDLQRLTELNAGIREFAFGAQEVVRWKAGDGLEIEGVLVKPPDWQPTQKYPLLLQIHGGPHEHVANTLLDLAEAQALAARGWLVLAPNYRGSSAYGHEFGVASRGDIGGKDFDDILAGVDYAIAQSGADPERMAVMGGSYGGYMTELLIARTKRFKAAVSEYGIFSLISDFSNSEFPSWERDYLAKSYWEDFALYVDRSAIKNVAQVTTPVLLLHGEEDNNTLISNSQELFRALKELGRTVKFVRFPREGHGFLEPQHRLEEFRLISDWLDEHVRGTAVPRAISPATAVRAGEWELQIAAVRTPEDFSGVHAKGRWVEIEIVIRATAPVEGRYSVLLFENAGSEVSLVGPQKTLYPEGVVAESLGQRVLAKSSSQVIAIHPDHDGRYAALAFRVAFDAPVSAREFMLKVKDFPPVSIELPADIH